MMAPARIAALDRARTFITLSVLLHHSVLNYTWFGHGDPMRWLGFDLVVLFNDSYFMACMFFISGSSSGAWRCAASHDLLSRCRKPRSQADAHAL
jgi:hypothetical protein